MKGRRRTQTGRKRSAVESTPLIVFGTALALALAGTALLCLLGSRWHSTSQRLRPHPRLAGELRDSPAGTAA